MYCSFTLASFPGSRAGEEEREPGTHCSRMCQVHLVTCILLRYTKINFCLPAEGHTAELYFLWDTFGVKNDIAHAQEPGNEAKFMPKIFGPTVAPENHQLHVTFGVTMQTLASNYTARKVDNCWEVPWVDKTLSKKYSCYGKDKVSYFAAMCSPTGVNKGLTQRREDMMSCCSNN